MEPWLKVATLHRNSLQHVAASLFERFEKATWLQDINTTPSTNMDACLIPVIAKQIYI